MKAINELINLGHSLGAHIAGTAGRNLNSMTSQLIPRITGLGLFLLVAAKVAFFDYSQIHFSRSC